MKDTSNRTHAARRRKRTRRRSKRTARRTTLGVVLHRARRDVRRAGRRRARGGLVVHRQPSGHQGREGGRPRDELGDLRRRRLPARGDRGEPQPHSGALAPDLAVPAQRHDRDRGQALLGARRAGLRGHRPRRLARRHLRQLRRGRLDHHPAGRPQPVHPGGEGQEDLPAQDRRGLARDPVRAQLHEGRHPHDVPEHRLLRQQRLRRRGRGPDLLLDARGEADAGPERPDRRPPAGADGLRPVHPSLAGPLPQEPGAERDARRRGHQEAGLPQGAQGVPLPQAQPHLPGRPPAHVLRLRQGAAQREARPGQHRPRAERRPAHRDDPRSAAAVRGPAGHQERPEDPRRPGGGDRLDRPEDRLHPGHAVVGAARGCTSTSPPRPNDRPARRSRRSPSRPR